MHRDEWPQGGREHVPPSNLAFSLEEAPAFGRGSSRTLKVFKHLDKVSKRRHLIDVMNIDISNDPLSINDEQGPFGDPV